MPWVLVVRCYRDHLLCWDSHVETHVDPHPHLYEAFESRHPQQAPYLKHHGSAYLFAKNRDKRNNWRIDLIYWTYIFPYSFWTQVFFYDTFNSFCYSGFVIGNIFTVFCGIARSTQNSTSPHTDSVSSLISLAESTKTSQLVQSRDPRRFSTASADHSLSHVNKNWFTLHKRPVFRDTLN